MKLSLRHDLLPVVAASMTLLFATGVAFGHLTLEFGIAYLVGYGLRSTTFFVFLILLSIAIAFGLARGAERFGLRAVAKVGFLFVAAISVSAVGTAYFGPATLDTDGFRYFCVFWLPVPSFVLGLLSWLFGRKVDREAQRVEQLGVFGLSAGIFSLILGVVVYFAKELLPPLLPDCLRLLLVLLTQTLPAACFALCPVDYMRDPRRGSLVLRLVSIAMLFMVALGASFG